MMATRESLEWHFKQLDHAVGLSFKSNFHFALVGHLLKGFRHPTPTTVSRTSRVLTMLLGIVAKPMQRDKFEVSSDSVAYLTGKIFSSIFIFWKLFLFSYKLFLYTSPALVAVSEEVRSRCHVKHTLPRWPVEAEPDLIAVDSDANQTVSFIEKVFHFENRLTPKTKITITQIQHENCKYKSNTQYIVNDLCT